ncbi:MAG: DUF3313 family protein [Halieaceae bacterium]|nr:DUF3313 family protein [Halieaceae bacterium]
MKPHVLIAAAAVTVMTACSSTEPTVQTGDDAEVIMGNLHKVDNSRTDLAYVDPEANFGKYNSVLVQPLGVDNVEIRQPNNSYSAVGNRTWELTDKDKENLRKSFAESMGKQMEKCGYPVVTEAGDDVLQVAAMITGIAPAAAKDDNSSRAVGRTRVYTEGAGAMAVAVMFGDSETGEVLAMIKDTRQSNSAGNWGLNNSVSNMADVRRFFNGWANQICQGLDRAHGK